MGVVSRRQVWLVGVGGIYGWNLLGVVVRRYIDFLILLIPTPIVSVLFYSNIPTFCSFKKMFFVLVPFFVIKYYVLKKNLSQYKHTYGQLWASHGSHMKAALNVLYMKKHTLRFISCDGHQLYDFKERFVDLEVEGVRYIEMHRGPAAYVLGPPPSRGRDLELEGGVNACNVEYVYESQDSHMRGSE